MPTIRSITLDCGMPLLVEPIPGVRSVGLTWALPLGSATDPVDREGLSAMAEELVFRGAGEHDSRAHADALDRLGVNRSADVGTMFLRLSATLLGDRLDDALGLVTDMVRRPRFDPDAIEPARDLCLQSLESLADNPHERASVALRERHNPAPINRSGLGTVPGLRAVTRDDLLGAWERRIRPVGSILGIAGAVDADAAARRLNGLLRGWIGSAAEVTWGTAPHKGTYHHIPDESNQVQVLLCHDAPPERDPASTLERLVISLLSGGTSARLFSEVREKRALCYDVGASYAADKAFGRVVAYVGTTPERAQESLDVLHAELARMAETDGAEVFDHEEFDRAQVGIKTRLVFSGESSGARAAALVSDYHRLGRARTLDEIGAAFDRVTVDELRQYLAARALGAVTTVTLGPAPLRPHGAGPPG